MEGELKVREEAQIILEERATIAEAAVADLKKQAELSQVNNSLK